MPDEPIDVAAEGLINEAVDTLVKGLTSVETLQRVEKFFEVLLINVVKVCAALIAPLARPVGMGLVTGISEGEEQLAPALEQLARETMESMTGVDVGANVAEFGGRGRSVAGAQQALGGQMLNALIGAAAQTGGGELQPSTEAAAGFVGMMTNLAFRGWMKGVMFEVLGATQLETFGELDDILVSALGLNRMSRGVMRPIANALITTPAQWDVNKRFRPNLLGAAEVARQVARGRLTREAGFEELARQGYSDQRIEALLNAAAKFHSTADVDLLVRSGQWTADQAIQHLKDQGYEDAIARGEFMIERLKRIASFERSLAQVAITAYAAGDIARYQLVDYTGGVTIDTQEQSQLLEIADARRALTIKHMSLAQVEQCVKAGILSVADYRAALEREGYPADEIAALELLLRHELDAEKTLEDLKAAQAAERAAAAQAKAAAQAARQQQVADALALERRGREADLRRAAVHGLIPVSRYEEVLAPKFDADTVSIMVGLVDQERAVYLAQQQQADDAKKRGAQRGLSIADVEQAVVDGALTMDDYRRRLASMGYDAPDVDVLAATLQARLDDLAAARARHVAIAQDAPSKGISLPKAEQLVRAGIRSIDDYRRLLTTAGYAVEDVAALVALLQQQLDQDAAAQQTHDQVETTAPAKGLSLAQLEAAVLGGVKSIDDYQRALLGAGYDVDAVSTLTTLLQTRITEADAARQARDQADAAPEPRELPLSVVQQAARLGIVNPDDYRAELVARGFSGDDADLQVQVLLTQIAGVQADVAVHDRVAGELAARGLSLAQFEASVRASIKSVDDYRAWLITQGYGGDAVDTLVQLLEDALAQQKDARKVHDRIAKRLADQGVDLAQLDAAVVDGAATIDQYAGELAAVGVTPAETGLLVGLLVQQLTDLAAAPAAGGAA